MNFTYLTTLINSIVIVMVCISMPYVYLRPYAYSFQKNPGATFIPSPTSIPENLSECLEEPYVMDLNKKASQNEGKRKYSTV